MPDGRACNVDVCEICDGGLVDLLAIDDLDEGCELYDGGLADLEAIDKLDEGARSRKLHVIAFLSQLAHVGCLLSHYWIKLALKHQAFP